MTSEASNRPSQAVLERLADVLMVTPQERDTLFEMALPRKWRVHLCEDSMAALKAFSRLRSLTRRLWTATSVDDALLMATESIADWFDDHLFVHTSHRREEGLWEARPTDDTREQHIVSSAISEWTEQLCPSSRVVDALNLYPQLRHPGDVGTDELHPPALQRTIGEYYEQRRLRGFTFLKARIRTRAGVIASVSFFNERGHSYTASDRAALAAFAEVASLALS